MDVLILLDHHYFHISCYTQFTLRVFLNPKLSMFSSSKSCWFDHFVGRQLIISQKCAYVYAMYVYMCICIDYAYYIYIYIYVIIYAYIYIYIYTYTSTYPQISQASFLDQTFPLVASAGRARCPELVYNPIQIQIYPL